MDPAQAVSVAISWLDIGKIVIASGAFSALVSHLLQWLKEHRKDSKRIEEEATLQAITLVGLLDRYLASCYSEVLEHDRAGYFQGKFCKVPELSIDEVKLDYFKPKVLAKLAWLQTERSLAFNTAYAGLEKDQCPDDFNEDCMSICGYSGYELFLVAKELRKQYKLPSFASGDAIQQKAEFLKKYWSRTQRLLKNSGHL